MTLCTSHTMRGGGRGKEGGGGCHPCHTHTTPRAIWVACSTNTQTNQGQLHTHKLTVRTTLRTQPALNVITPNYTKKDAKNMPISSKICSLLLFHSPPSFLPSFSPNFIPLPFNSKLLIHTYTSSHIAKLWFEQQCTFLHQEMMHSTVKISTIPGTNSSFLHQQHKEH